MKSKSREIDLPTCTPPPGLRSGLLGDTFRGDTVCAWVLTAHCAQAVHSDQRRTAVRCRQETWPRATATFSCMMRMRLACCKVWGPWPPSSVLVPRDSGLVGTRPSPGISRSRSSCFGCCSVVTIILPLSLDGRLKSFHCMTWPQGSRRTHCLRVITTSDDLKLPTVASFHGAGFNSQMALFCG